MGAIRPTSGIYRYNGTDIIGSTETVDSTLNKLADSVHDSINADRARLNTLEGRMSAADLAAIPTTPLNSYTKRPGTVAFRLGDIVFLSADLSRDAGVANAVCMSMPAEYGPGTGLTIMGVASQGGNAENAVVVIGTNGQVRCWTTSSANKTLSFQAFWPIP